VYYDVTACAGDVSAEDSDDSGVLGDLAQQATQQSSVARPLSALCWSVHHTGSNMEIIQNQIQTNLDLFKNFIVQLKIRFN
jgi:hypothetical protein